MTAEQGCRCGADAPFAAHCESLLDGEPAATAEALMRSRYTAYALLQQGDSRAAAHLWRTWHPRTRPATVEPSPGLRWTGLTVRGSSGGGDDDATGQVRFVAAWEIGEGATRQHGELAETADFVRRGARWVYLEGRAD